MDNPPLQYSNSPIVSPCAWDIFALLRLNFISCFNCKDKGLFTYKKNFHRSHMSQHITAVFTDTHCMIFFTAVIEKSNFIKDLAAAQQIE